MYTDVLEYVQCSTADPATLASTARAETITDLAMADPKLTLHVLPERFAICRLHGDDPIPPWALAGVLSSITRTADELSVVCPQRQLPEGVTAEKGWRCLQVAGPLDLSLIGIIATLATTLAQAGVGLFAISTYDTDYLLVKEQNLGLAIAALKQAGHQIHP